jgi:peptidoglycan L-alanyl-D-glutamate endopeptidase CwlK
MVYTLSQKSLDRLKGVHPDLVKVVKRAIELTPVDFRITEGLRTKERQAYLMKKGATRTMRSRHITGHAIDFVALPNGVVSWDFPLYAQISQAFKKAAAEVGVFIIWGGDWKSFRDGPHIELNRKFYP